MNENYSSRLFQFLIQQCKNPSGVIGSVMNSIWNKSFDSMTVWAIKNMAFSFDDYILDIGCGGGATVNKLAKNISKQGKIYGIDISKISVINSRKKNKAQLKSKKVEIIQARAEKMPFSSNTFDKVFAIQTHIYWSNIDKGLNEVLRVLKPNCFCYIICEKDKIAYHLEEYKDIWKMIELVKSVGFSNVDYLQTEKWIMYVSVK